NGLSHSEVSEAIILASHRNCATAGDGGGHLRKETSGGSRRHRVAADEPAQFRHLILQSSRLRVEFLRGAGAFLRAGRIALGNLVQLGDGSVDLFDTLSLLPFRSSDFSDQRVGRGHLLGDLHERFLDLSGALGTLSAAGDRYFYLICSFLGRGGAPLSQRA